MNYILPAGMDAIHKEGGKKCWMDLISWMLKGNRQEHEVSKQSIKAAKGKEGDMDEDDVKSNEGDIAEGMSPNLHCHPWAEIKELTYG